MKPAPSQRAAARSAVRVPPAGRPRATRSPGVASSPKGTRRSSDATILDVAGSLSRLSVFTVAARVAGLDDLLSGAGPYTVFAPTDRAFAKMPKPVLDALMMDPAGLAEMLCHHVVPGRVKAPRSQTPGLVLPVAGPELSVTREAEAVYVDGARVVRANIGAANGVIHAIDAVLTMP